MATGTQPCPACGGAVRPGDPWCTLCWADLRPKPAPVPVPPPVPAPVPVPAAVAAPAPVALPAAPVAPVAPVDPLTAPLAAVLAQPLAADPGAPAAAAAWPCVECGARNALDLDACGVCATPFGGRISRVDDVKGTRRKTLMYALGAVGAFLALLGLITFALTDTSSIEQNVPTKQEGPLILPEE